MSNTTIIWLSMALIYFVFWCWYVGFGHKIEPAEVDAIIEKMRLTDLAVDEDKIRSVIANDDGKDLVIVNLLKLNEPKKEAQEQLNKYSTPFMIELLKRGGHPVMISQVSGPAVEYWGLEPGGEEWDMAVAVRYRSRRDLFEMATWPAFAELHPFKKQGLAKTIAVPASQWTTLGGIRLHLAMLLVIVGLLLSKYLT